MPLRAFAAGLEIQGFAPPLRLRDFGLLAFDMDCALAGSDWVAEIAEAIGMKEEVAAITAAAMRGGTADEQESLRRRVRLLRGATMADLEQAYTGSMQIDPGAARLVQACKAAGLGTLLVCGGFTFFTDRVRDKLGVDFARSGVLEVRSGPNCGELTGRIVAQPWGEICGAGEKRAALLETCGQLGIAPRQAIAVGGAAGDLPMLAEAGLSVAYHAPPKVRGQAMVAIDQGGLDRLLELFA